MDPDQGSSRARKVKYVPRKPKPQAHKTEPDNKRHEDRAQARALSRRYENLARREPKVEKKSSVEVAFCPGVSSPSLRTYGTSKAVDSGTSSGSSSKYFAKEKIGLRRSSAATEDQNDSCMIDVTDDATNASARKIKGDYKEPWDYDHSYYPTTLPLRKPNSGDPEILDEEEFGEGAASVEYDENTVNPATELGLLEKSEQQRMLFFKFPTTLPLDKQSNKGKEQIGTSTVLGKPKGIALEELSRGYMGKMLVYKSGAIKLKLGEALLDVSPGSNCVFAQDIVAVNTAQKQCCNLGELSKRVVVVPDLDSIEL
ncbi:DNA-directed RNA polymerase III subunit RPC4 [Spatholobus suberectus]|nr:DNA-directed RNA polymerase III subunit RPC4 [Spatholobus suberectus]